MSVKQGYVLGFVFDDKRIDARVLLLKKARPAWQAGCLNGVGGKVEEGEHEDTRLAMVREAREKVGLDTDVDDWALFSVIQGDAYRVDCYRARLPLDGVTACEDEPVVLCRRGHLRATVDGVVAEPLLNVPALVEMAHCHENVPDLQPVVWQYGPPKEEEREEEAGAPPRSRSEHAGDDYAQLFYSHRLGGA